MAKKSFQNYTSIGSASAKLILENLPFVLFLGFLAIIYIANAHYAEGQVREIQETKREVRELKREYNSQKAELMRNSRHSVVEKNVKDMGLHIIREKPIKITLDN